MCLLISTVCGCCPRPGMLEGMSRIEAEAYTLLAQLGATPVSRVLTAGGGAMNDKWTAMRAAALGVPVAAAAQGALASWSHCSAGVGVRGAHSSARV
jgi:sugar (pentulose or hexulose) kinase